MTIDIHSLVGAFALGALDPDEIARFQAHLENCYECQNDLAKFREASSRLDEL